MTEGLNIYQRLHAVMGEIDYIQKEKKQGMRYSIVSHDKVTAAVRPLLHKHGIVYHIAKLENGQDGNRTSVRLAVAFINIDNPQDRIISESFGYGVDDQDKGPGKAMSYAVKYALLKTLGLETGDEPDETQDEKANYKPPAISPREFPTKPDDVSAAKSKTAWEVLDDAMKRNKTPAALNKWWFDNKREIYKSMSNEFFWRFYIKVMERGADISKSKLELDLFWSTHADKGLPALKDANQEEHDAVIEYMLTKATNLNAGLVDAG